MSSNDDRRNKRTPSGWRRDPRSIGFLSASVILAFSATVLPAPAAAAEPVAAPEPAESDSATPRPEPGEAPTDSAATDAPAADEPAEGTGPGGFVPSEEISEDFAVSFPVDI